MKYASNDKAIINYNHVIDYYFMYFSFLASIWSCATPPVVFAGWKHDFHSEFGFVSLTYALTRSGRMDRHVQPVIGQLSEFQSN